MSKDMMKNDLTPEIHGLDVPTIMLNRYSR